MNYWVVIDRKKIGPLTLEETLRMPLTPQSYVWHSGLPTWVRAEEVGELAPMFASAPSPSATNINKEAEEGADAMLTVEQEMALGELQPDADSTPEEELLTAESAEDEQRDLSQGTPEPEESEATPTENHRPAAPMLPPPPPPYRPAPPIHTVSDGRPQRPPSYLGWCVASIICCCMITGIIGVISAARVNPLYDRGQYVEAQKASERAELWLIISIVAGLVAVPFQFVLMFAQ